MSASTQQGQTGQTIAGNGHHIRSTKPGRKPGVKAAAKPANQQGVAGAAAQAVTQPNVLAERRIGPIPTGPLFQPGSIAWLRSREMELSIELRLIRSMIGQFTPRGAATVTGATRKKAKKAKRKASIKQAA